uniref:Uncharacterized protein n=1 Tax=Peronospora matthiolae TaxID=2874970 RepID=A0AAV1UY33_9STRA
MKITALAITALATVASVASADDYQPALRALAAQEPTAPIADTLASDPTKQQSSSPVEAAAAAANTEHDVDDDSKKAKEWWGRPGWGHRWGGYGWGRPWGGVATVVAGVDTVAAGDGRRHTSTTPSTRLQPAALSHGRNRTRRLQCSQSNGNRHAHSASLCSLTL